MLKNLVKKYTLFVNAHDDVEGVSLNKWYPLIRAGQCGLQATPICPIGVDRYAMVSLDAADGVADCSAGSECGSTDEVERRHWTSQHRRWRTS